ncbi:hypothetical protein OF83DRAFT_1045415, partial [Amylostereum chailletii]
DNRIYEHRIMTANFTAYDVRRKHDVLNSGGPRKNIMMLAAEAEPGSGSPNGEPERFLYAQVLGIYHTNALYTGPGMLDWKPRRYEFLWVRYYR